MPREFEIQQLNNDMGYEAIDDVYEKNDAYSIGFSDFENDDLEHGEMTYDGPEWESIDNGDELQYLNTDEIRAMIPRHEDESGSRRKRRRSLFGRKSNKDDYEEELREANYSEYQKIRQDEWDIGNGDKATKKQSFEAEPEYGPDLSFGPDITIDKEAIYNAAKSNKRNSEQSTVYGTVDDIPRQTDSQMLTAQGDDASKDLITVDFMNPEGAAEIVPSEVDKSRRSVNNQPQLKQDSSAFVDADMVVEKAEFEKIDISREEARGTIPYKELRDMCIQFAKINESGVSVRDTIRILVEQTEDDELREALESIHDQIKSGEDLSTAMSNCACFPFAFTIAVSAAEKNDLVAVAFRRFGDIFDREIEHKEMEKMSVFYPTLVTVCSLFVMIIMMLVVYPNFVSMFSELGTELPQLSKALLSVASYFDKVWWILSVVFVLVLLAILCYKKLSKADLLGPKLGEKSVPEGSFKRMDVYSKFARYMNVLLDVGVATKDALFVTAHSFTEYPFLTARLLDAANAAAAGSTLSNALCVFEFFPIMILQMISVGEEMGDTPKMLMHIAEYYEEESRREANRKAAKREPVSIVIMAVVVLFLLLSMLQPILKFYELVNQI